MAALDSESLRREYNDHFRKARDNWSCHDLNEAAQIVDLVLKQTEAMGNRATTLTNVLDVGCAKGHITEAFRLRGLESHGLDYSDVAIELARITFPDCYFHHGDGFNPQFDRKFDLIFMRGFSGCNTLDLQAVATLAKKYTSLLNSGGLFVLGYSSDFTGEHRTGDTVCWSWSQVNKLVGLIRSPQFRKVTVPQWRWYSSSKLRLARLLGRRSRYYLYLFLRAESDPLSRDHSSARSK